MPASYPAAYTVWLRGNVVGMMQRRRISQPRQCRLAWMPARGFFACLKHRVSGTESLRSPKRRIGQQGANTEMRRVLPTDSTSYLRTISSHFVCISVQPIFTYRRRCLARCYDSSLSHDSKCWSVQFKHGATDSIGFVHETQADNSSW